MQLLHASPNLLTAMLQEYEHLSKVIRVIDVATASGGRVLRVLMNSELDEAVAVLAEAGERNDEAHQAPIGQPQGKSERHWRWRMQMAEKIAAEIDPKRFAVAGMYVIGSTKNASAGPSSDIDLLIHIQGDDEQRHDLEIWLEGWSLCLGEINYLRTGYVNPDLLDVHIITDEDVKKRTSFAAKIGAVTDAALALPVGIAERSTQDE